MPVSQAFYRNGTINKLLYENKWYNGGYIIKSEAWHNKDYYKEIFKFNNEQEHVKDRLIFYLRHDGGEQLINVKDIIGKEINEKSTYFIMWSIFNMNLLTSDCELLNLHEKLINMGFRALTRIKEPYDLMNLFINY